MKNYVLHKNEERRTKNGESEHCSLEAVAIRRSSLIVRRSATERSPL